MGQSTGTQPQQGGAVDAAQDSASQTPFRMKLLQGATKGILNGVQNMYSQPQQQGGGGSGMGPMPQAQPVSPDYFGPTQSKKPNPYFYGYGG